MEGCLLTRQGLGSTCLASSEGSTCSSRDYKMNQFYSVVVVDYENVLELE